MELNGLPDGSRPTRCHKPVADLAERERQREDLRDALDRKRRVAVAAGSDVAVGVDHREAEGARIDAGQFGNVGRDLAAIRPLPHLVGDFGYDLIKVGHGVARLTLIISSRGEEKRAPLVGAPDEVASPS